MNYTGFGTDPNLIYSFRRNVTNPAIGTSFGGDRFSGLRNSIAYRQADLAGKQRMEQAVEMGLPANTDIGKVQRTGLVGIDNRPQYVAPRPQAFGTWGALSGPMSEEGVSVTGGFNKKENLPSGSYSKTLGWNTIPRIPFIGSFY